MKNVIIKILILLVFVQFTSCVKEKNVDKKEQKVQKSIVSDTIFDEKNPYYIFLKKNNPEAFTDNELIFFKEEDIDLDGKKEAVVALGEVTKGSELENSINEIFLLRNDYGIIKNLYDFGQFGYSVYKIKLISLQGQKQKYIYLGLTNHISMMGFDLFELKNNRVVNICYSASASGRGEDELVDMDNDGKYDGYTQFRTSTDALYYDVTMSYVFKDNKFKLSETHVDIPSEYPDTIQEILLQYISLKSLNFGESKEINRRLKLISKDLDALNTQWNGVWGSAYLNTVLDLDNHIEIVIQENPYVATASYIDEDQKEYQCQFELKEIANQWQITKVTILKDGE